jgi:hypothetical protein
MPRRRRLVVEQLETREVLSFTFNAGVLIIHADTANSNDSVKIVAAGAAHDGSTGVQVRSNLVNHGQPTNFGGSGNPVTRVTLDLQNGNDKVSIDNLAQVRIRVGEGNGNNDIHVGDALDIGVAAGNGHNHVDLGAGLQNGAGGLAPGGAVTSATVSSSAGALQGGVVTPAGTVALLGWSYTIDTSTGGLFTPIPPIGGNRSGNDVKIHDQAGKTAIVDIAGNGSNSVEVGDGDDIVWIQGSGNNHIQANKGNNQVQVDGNGNNDIKSKGTGSITVNGQGNNEIDAGTDPRSAVFLSFTKPGGHNHVKAATGASVQVSGVAITKSGKVANTNTTVNFAPRK